MMTKRRKSNNNTILVLLAKNLIPNYAKTRLIKGSSIEVGFEIYKSLLTQTLILLYAETYDAHVLFSKYKEFQNSLLKSISIDTQINGTLSEKIAQAFDSGKNMGYKKTSVIGSDCPNLTQDIVNKGFQLLDKNDVVFGPSTDGGFYLIACKSLNTEIFDNVRWSTDQVLNQCLENAKNLNLSVALLPALKDIDEIEDWERYINK